MRAHPILVQGAGAKRATRWFLVDEYDALAEGTLGLPHGGEPVGI
jgi:hypothetical protein